MPPLSTPGVLLIGEEYCNMVRRRRWWWGVVRWKMYRPASGIGFGFGRGFARKGSCETH
jgi:hypothetical protein